MQRSTFVGFLAAAAAILLVVPKASAQGTAQANSSYGAAPKLQGLPMYQAPGFRLGSAVLHPDFKLSVGYDSNVFYQSGSEDPAGSVMLTLDPGLSLENGSLSKGQRKVEYNARLGFQYKRYFQELKARTQRDFFGANVAGLVNVFPEGTFGFDLHETFLRTSEPRYAVSNANYDRDHNVAGLGFNIRPGGGMLQFRLGYRIAVDYFEDSDLSGANYYYHQVEFYAKWKFFPQTSWWFGMNWQFINYWGSTTNSMYSSPGSKPVRLMMGVSGRFLPRLVLTGGIGYGYSWYDKGPDYNLPLGMVDVTIEVGPTAKVSLGYEHNFQDVMLGNFYSVDTAYLTYYHVIANRVELSATARWLRAGFEGIKLGTGVTPVGQAACGWNDNRYCSRTDNAVSLGLQARYLVTSWFSAGLAYRLLANFSDFKFTDGTNNYDTSYTKHVAVANAIFSY